MMIDGINTEAWEQIFFYKAEPKSVLVEYTFI